MKKHKKELSAGKRFTLFLKHYFGYLLMALVCAVATVLAIGVA